MKKIKNFMSIFVCLLFIASIGYSQQSSVKMPDKSKISIGNGSASAMFANCNINAGGDISYCINSGALGLFGSESGIDLSTVSWSLISGPSTVTIASSTSLITSFVGTPLTLGTYSFEISGNCTADNAMKADTVNITILPTVVTAIISDALGVVTADPYPACTDVQLFGSNPGPGQTGVWAAATNPSGHSWSQTGNTLDASMTAWNTCETVTYYYTISNGNGNGGCVSVDTVNVRYERVASPVAINGGNQTFCGDTVQVVGSFTGCAASATSSWQIIPPSGVAIPNSFASGRSLFIYFTQGGTYQITYNVASNGVCPGGSATVTYNVCFSSANGIGGNRNIYYCDDFPDTVFLSSIVDPSYTYSNWTLSGGAGTPPVNIVQTTVGQGYALIYDQTPNQYTFDITATGNTCTFPGQPVLPCQATRRIRIRRAASFDLTADTLNIFCQEPGVFYRPSTYINTSGIGNFTIQATQVPAGCLAISTGVNYSSNSNLDFSCEGTYIFRAVTNRSTGNPLEPFCRDTLFWVVNVATLQKPSAGSDAMTKICDNDTVPLVGSVALDILGNPNPFAISTWTQIDGHPPVTFLGSMNSQIVDVTGFSVVGTYMFEYSFSRDSGCYLADTMIVIVKECDSCPEFVILTCCDLTPQLSSSTKSKTSSSRTVDARVTSALTTYKKAVQSAYPVKSAVNGDPCCDFCEYPNVAFPIFIYDTDGNLISDVDYNISWSNDPTNTTAIGSAMTENMVIVTVSGPDSCVWIDTFLIECCETPGNDGICCDTIDFEVDIDSVCKFDPCKYPTSSFPIRVLRNGVVLTTSGYTFQWSTGQNSSAISVNLGQLPVSVIVTDLATGCIDTGVYDIDCTPSCVPVVPTRLSCNTTKGWQILTWATSPGLTYEVEIIYNDPFCVKGGTGTKKYNFFVSGGSYTVNVSPITGCLSWRVRSICPDGTKSAWTAKQCCCIRIITKCIPIVPTDLKCSVTRGGQLLTWNAVAGASYEISFYYGDPKCCKRQIGYVTIPASVRSNSFLVSSTKCFSWQVRSVCPDGKKSAWSSSSCSCSSIIVPTGDGKTRINVQSSGNTTGHQEMNVSTVPNPAKDFVTFNVATTDATTELGEIVIMSLTGEVVYKSYVKLNGSSMVDVTDLSGGTYIYKVISGTTFKSGRIVIID